MVKTRTRLFAIMVGVLVIAALVWVVVSRDPRPTATSPQASASAPASETDEPARIAPTASAAVLEATATPVVDADDGDDASVVLAARWGSGRGELGRSRPQEGNPEGPMSFARTGDELLVLDQVNGRVARYDANGKLRATFETTETTQDLTVAKDGTVALLDRLVDKTVRLVDRNGRPIGALPLPADRVEDPGLVTGVFVDGKDVYVEKEHGVLTRIGSTDGSAADPAELTGRPSKDGALLLMAVLASAEAHVTLNAFDRRAGSLRFARVIHFPRPARQIMLLDSDMRGKIYVGVLAGSPQMVHIACLDPGDGHAIGRLSVPTSATPEEAFRDFTIADDGTILLALRTEEGIEYRSAYCP